MSMETKYLLMVLGTIIVALVIFAILLTPIFKYILYYVRYQRPKGKK